MDLSNLFLASLNPQTRSQAEASLLQASIQSSFLVQLLQLVLNTSERKEARQAACVYFKNTVKRRWNEDVSLLQLGCHLSVYIKILQIGI